MVHNPPLYVRHKRELLFGTTYAIRTKGIKILFSFAIKMIKFSLVVVFVR